MDLEVLVESIRGFPGITRKRTISDVVEYLPMADGKTILASAGEDAAVLEHNGSMLLLAADGIMESLMKTNPFYAGYFSVLVNVNDIAAMGGTPLAMVDILSIKDEFICAQVMKGIKRAVAKFGVPVVGGHTHPDCAYHAVDIAILGSAEKGAVIFSHTANVGDDVVFCMDLDGFYPPDLDYCWDTTTKRTDEMAQEQIRLLPEIGREHLVSAGKDMSNPGCIGTLGMLLETSGKGGRVDVDKIPMPDGVDPIQWILSYQGFGFVFTCPPENSQTVISMMADVGAEGAVVGSVVDGRKLVLHSDGEERTLFDFEKEIITGCTPNRVPGYKEGC